MFDDRKTDEVKRMPSKAMLAFSKERRTRLLENAGIDETEAKDP